MSPGKRVSISAPASVGILGDPGDLFGGAVLACGLGVRVTATTAESNGLEIQYGQRAQVIRWAGDLKCQGDDLDAVRVTLEYLNWGMEAAQIICSGGPERGWGLGDYAPGLVSLLATLCAWRGQDATPHKLAESAYRLEREALGHTGSLAAAYVAAFGGLCFLEFHGRGGPNCSGKVYGSVEQLSPLVPRLPLAVAHMGAGRPARDAVAGLRERWLAGDAVVVEAYTIINQLAQEGKKALLDGDWATLGRLMSENAIIQSNLTAVDPASEELVEVALRAGALGVRPLGAGECGSVVALHPQPEEVVRVWESAGAEIIPIAYLEGTNG